MRNLPTDLQILNTIYDRYYAAFVAYPYGAGERAEKIYVPLDLQAIADELAVDVDIVFGRLYYHLEQRYCLETRQGAVVHFFMLKMKEEKHCIHFPYMASVLAQLRDEDRRMRIPNSISIGALIVSFASLIVSVLAILNVIP